MKKVKIGYRGACAVTGCTFPDTEINPFKKWLLFFLSDENLYSAEPRPIKVIDGRCAADVQKKGICD
jgi:hypothetical protein